ncbi:MAG: hypothetical protein AB7U82_30090 [Blastocatellales bacterium]
MSKKLFLIVIALLFLPNTTASAQEGAPVGRSFVQSASEERLFTVTVYSAKPEKWSEALRFIKEEAVPANIKGGRKHMEVWTSVYGQSYESWFILPLENFAALDKPDETLLKGLGSREAVAAFWNKARSLNNSARQFVIRVRPDLSYIKPNAPAPRLATVVKSEIVPQRMQEYESFVKNDGLPVVKKSGRIGEVRANIVFGGTGVLSFAPQESFANLDKGSAIRQVLDVEAVRKMLSKLQGVLARVETTVLVFRPDLSILPK